PVGTSLGINNDIIFSVPWGHHCTLIDKYFETGERETALFYVHKIVEGGWSRNVLKSLIDTSLHLRQGKALTSFSRLLPAPDSDLAQELTKDPYIFDFTEMTEPYKERELKKALMANISRFLLELGSGFAYVGEEYRLKVGHTEQFIDLLFYNVKLHAYCVIDLLCCAQHKMYYVVATYIVDIAQENKQLLF
ncbi:MAG: PDDEXK nuclease domain-containing protein, partial [Muribaculaceae bacterium]|nr:PDDEXK nuclease domain-containing protein [Muribaculaceae bacterium]